MHTTTNSWWIRYLPTFLDLLVASLFVRIIVFGDRARGLLADGDTGWHIRVGDWILEHGTVPHTDVFSFSKPGQPWFAWEWLSDICLSLVHKPFGLAGVAVASTVVIALAAVVLFLQMLWRGANVCVAFAVFFFAVAACSVHYLARPHLATILLMSLAWWILARDVRHPDRMVWVLVPLSSLWVNLHGGFFALPGTLTLMAVGSWIDGRLRSGAEAHNWTLTKRYAFLTVTTMLASLLNPYGPRLHLHVARYMSEEWIKNHITEFLAPNFRSFGQSSFEVLLLASLVVAGILVTQKRFAEVVVLMGWSHLALTSARHIPLFAIISAPIVAEEISRWWGAAAGQKPARAISRVIWDLGLDLSPGFRRLTIWAGVLSALVVLVGLRPWRPVHFPSDRFPVGMVEAERERLISGRVFTSDDWADYLLYGNYPQQRVFFDGRSDFYGPAIGNEYLKLINALPGYKQLLEKYAFDVALLPVNSSLVSVLEVDPGWEKIKADKVSVVFAKRPNALK